MTPGYPRLRGKGIVGRERDAFEPEAARHDLVPRPLEDAQLRVSVALERPVAVEVVRLEVEQDGDLALELVHVLELERRELAHDPRVLRHHDARQRRADVPGDRDRPSGGAEDRAEQLRRGRLPVRAR